MELAVKQTEKTKSNVGNLKMVKDAIIGKIEAFDCLEEDR